ncbi:hypothetical protein Rt10032_c13g5011 [Rhodotorula toruloides]|uniref:Uncharacterized protein n=1 Tax=Rhodotorula toruloides TaxID=5286 RepID=A0A511KN98_RHOTO|nr:hypothetical protein Rt10032_c13g5011 [Rhodotorula toruloides]
MVQPPGPPPVPPRPILPPPIPPRPGAAPPTLAPRPAGPPAFPPVVRGRLLADGSEATSGVLSKGVKWQASGILEEGCNMQGQDVMIARPVTIHMGGPGESRLREGSATNRDPFLASSSGGRDVDLRIDCFTRSKWRFHLSPSLPTSSRFFHLTQLLSREQGGFVVALGLVNGKIKISSVLPTLVGSDGQPVPLPEMPAEGFWGRTTYHRMAVKWGPGGSVDYTIQDDATLAPLLRYAVSNVGVPAQGSIKTGLYRAHVCSAATAVVGDFEFKRR